MTHASLVSDLVSSFKARGRIVIVGASLAGLRAAEALRDEGFTGELPAKRARRGQHERPARP